jgi:hypothetical protein
MTLRNFKGFPSLKEVECSGSELKSDADLLSLTLFAYPRNKPLAILDVFKSSCNTFAEFSSCDLDTADTKKSIVRTLTTIEEGQTMMFGCNVTTRVRYEHTLTYSSDTWSVSVYRESKFGCLKNA